MDDWTLEQLAAAVHAYRLMERNVIAGTKFSKAQIYRDLSQHHGRSTKAWEYRMQNISHVLTLVNQPWLKGFMPKANVGPEVTRQLIKLLGVSMPSAASGSTTTKLEQQRELAEESGFFVPESVEDERNRTLAMIVRRQGQQLFRLRLLQAYNGRCAMTGCAVVDVLEAAHIQPYRGKQTNAVANGLLLRTDVHTLFDLQLVSVDTASMKTCVAPALRDTEYGHLHGSPLAKPQAERHCPSQRQLDQHRARCDW